MCLTKTSNRQPRTPNHNLYIPMLNILSLLAFWNSWMVINRSCISSSSLAKRTAIADRESCPLSCQKEKRDPLLMWPYLKESSPESFKIHTWWRLERLNINWIGKWNYPPWKANCPFVTGKVFLQLVHGFARYSHQSYEVEQNSVVQLHVNSLSNSYHPKKEHPPAPHPPTHTQHFFFKTVA